MDNTPLSDTPANAVSQLGESLAQTAQSQHALLQDMTHFAKEESLRFMNLRLERNGSALDKLQHCQGLPGLLGVQQEWLRDLVQDYMSQNMRLAGAFRGMAQNVVVSAAQTASQTVDQMQQDAGEAVEQAGQQMEQMAQTVDDYVQQTQH